MKIGEKIHDADGSKFVVEGTFDPNPTLNGVGEIREQLGDQRGDMRHVARIPGWMLTQWCKDAGVALSDSHACQEVLRKKLLSGDAAAFRTWEGSF